MKPVIAITCSYDSLGIIGQHFHAENVNYCYLRKKYCDVVLAGGGLPILFPFHPGAQILKKVDGLIISGGSIYQLDRSGILTSPNNMEEYKRPIFEMALLERAKKIDLPVLGICYGGHLLNIFQGGTLKWLPKHHEPGMPHHMGKEHKVLIKDGTLLYNIIKKKEMVVYSSHRQAIDKVGKGLVVSATSEDGVIEAIELSDRRFFLGVQWHPEVDPVTPHLFQRFVQACSLNRKRNYKLRVA